MQFGGEFDGRAMPSECHETNVITREGGHPAPPASNDTRDGTRDGTR
jgi:hypothetical protein